MSNYIRLDLDTMTERQSWAAGSLAIRFNKAGTLETISPARDSEVVAFLDQSGFDVGEIDIMVSHMNATTEIILAMDTAEKNALELMLAMSSVNNEHDTLPPPKP